MFDLGPILALADSYDEWMKVVRESFDRREHHSISYEMFLASLSASNSFKAFEALRPLVMYVRELEKEKYILEFALKSVLCDLIELNPAYCGPCHGCRDGKKETPLLCQAAMLEAYKKEAKEAGE